MHPLIPLTTIRELLCRHCGRYVSCGPVFVVPDGGILCGRCQNFAKPKYRNLAYEAIASIYFYVCTYWSKHCNENLRWDDSYEHEEKCAYRNNCTLLFVRPSAICKTERKIPENEDIVYEHVPDQILEILKCVACESYLSCDPVYIGPDGKNVCHRCVTSNGIPKSCLRNLSYERIAANVIFPCIYRYRGCPMRIPFGREMWRHEAECPYGQVYQKTSAKRQSRNGAKERGVIQTHSGHYYGTITPNSALFAPPTNQNNDNPINQEINNAIKKKQTYERAESIDSMDDVASKTSSRPPTREDTVSFNSRDFDFSSYLAPQERKISTDSILSGRQSQILPSPAPIGYNKPQNYGYISPSLEYQFPYLFHFPPLGYNNQLPRASRNDSFKVGNPNIIDEIKQRQQVKRQNSERLRENGGASPIN